MKKGFTLVELIVVIAIIAILSTVGFVSYNGYIRDSRNSVRQSDIASLGNVITQFNATQQYYPRCATGTNCDFSETGMNATDWAVLEKLLKKTPIDPKKDVSGGGAPADVHYKYGTDGVNFELGATLESDTVANSKAIVKGSTDGKQGLLGAGVLPTGLATCADSNVVDGGCRIPYNFQ